MLARKQHAGRGQSLGATLAMLHAIAERDWKVLHQLREIALDRFCQRVLSEIGRLASEPDKSSHERYLAVFKLIERRDKELANAFDNPSQSKGLLQLACMQALDLLTEEECRALAWTPARQFSCWEVNRSLYATAPCWRGVPVIKYPAFVA